jgi:DeoR/GlpR family transcriptional regulator of sugar metabolism
MESNSQASLSERAARSTSTPKASRACKAAEAILARAKRKVLLADSTKWERPSIIRFAEWSEIDDWITDKLPTAKEVKRLKSFGLNLHVARGWKHA